ncbi:MAG: hypothetical protein GY808_03540 [Gammaproteobacteria bacterium]|nr:hypothetical protein [Gammaproteobacteria bacterium]
MDWDYLQQSPSPRENMHSILLLHINRHEVEIADRTSNPHFEVAAWLRIKNTAQLPAMLLIEYKDLNGSRWQTIDTARISAVKSTILLSGIVDINVRKLKSIDLYLCHPSTDIICEVEELRFNNKLMKRDFLQEFNVA